MYADLGCSWLSNLVTEKYIVSSPFETSFQSNTLQEMIRERTTLLIYSDRARNDINPKAEKNLNELVVLQTKNIQIKRNFKEKNDIQNISACFLDGKLYITSSDMDYFDVAR